MAIPRERLTRYQYEAFIAQPENHERLFELIDGEIIEKMPTQEHADFAGELIFALKWHLKQNPHIVDCVLPEARYQLPHDEENARIPDVSFVSIPKDKLVKRGAAPYMPDLAIEIKSPDDSYEEMRQRAAYYLANGSKMVWLGFPQRREVEVHLAGKIVLTLTIDDTLDGGDVVPGFKLKLRDLF
jgi:Uma2 family endonuclease